MGAKIEIQLWSERRLPLPLLLMLLLWWLLLALLRPLWWLLRPPSATAFRLSSSSLLSSECAALRRSVGDGGRRRLPLRCRDLPPSPPLSSDLRRLCRRPCSRRSSPSPRSFGAGSKFAISLSSRLFFLRRSVATKVLKLLILLLLDLPDVVVVAPEEERLVLRLLAVRIVSCGLDASSSSIHEEEGWSGESTQGI